MLATQLKYLHTCQLEYQCSDAHVVDSILFVVEFLGNVFNSGTVSNKNATLRCLCQSKLFVPNGRTQLRNATVISIIAIILRRRWSYGPTWHTAIHKSSWWSCAGFAGGFTACRRVLAGNSLILPPPVSAC